MPRSTRRARIVARWLVWSSLLLAGAPARADQLDEARQRMEALQLEEAIDALAAVDRAPDVPAATRLAALVLLVECRLALEDTDGARVAARRVYALDPGYSPDEATTPRRVLRFLDEARQQHPPPVPVEIGPPRLAVGEDGVSLDVPVPRGRSAVHRLRVRWSTDEGAARVADATPSGEGYRALLGPIDPRSRVLATFAASAPSGEVLAELGPVTLHRDRPRPRASAPARRRSGSVWSSPALWIGAGAVVTAGVVTALALSSGGSGCRESLEPGGRVCLP